MGDISVVIPIASLAEIPGLPIAVTAALFAVAVYLARRFNAHAGHMVLGAVIGLVAVAGWAGSSVLFLFSRNDCRCVLHHP